MNKKFNTQFATQKLRQETSATNFGGATFNPGTGEQMATNKAFKKKEKKEVKDVEPKYAAGKAKIYMKDKWGWKMAPSIPNRPSKGGFIYKQLFEELSEFIKENQIGEEKEEILTGGIPFRKESGKDYDKITITEPLPDEVKDRMIAKFRKAGWDAKPNNAGGITAVKKKYFVSDNIKEEKVSQINFQELSQELSEFVKENEPVEELFSREDYEKAKKILDQLKNTNSKLYNAILNLAADIYPHDLEKELGADIKAAGLNENYSRFKTETKTRNKPDQFHQAVRAVKKKVQEINRLFEYVSRLKEELSEGQDGLKYKMHTEKALAKIKDMVNELNKNIKKFK